MAFAKLAVETICNRGDVDFEKRVFKAESFKDSETECIHNKLINDTANNFYKQMIATFSTDDFEVLNFEVGALPNGDWGYTTGHEANTATNPLGLEINLDFYTVRISNLIESSSNVSQMVILCHEIIHAYMYNSLDNLGIITYDTNGNPEFNTTIQCTDIQPNISLNTLSEKDRWIALICAYNANNPGDDEWTHTLFNTANFDLNTYRVNLEQLILNNHDWDNEPIFLKSYLQGEFGSQWKQKASEFISWKGLEKTDEFIAWAQNNNISSNLDTNGEIVYPEHSLVIINLRDLGKKDCL